MTVTSGGKVISVVIPIYNSAAYLGETLASVLEQDYRPLEVIAVDDGSSDESAGVVKSFGPHVRYLYQSNAGVGAARNCGVKAARGDYLSFIDADDRMVSGCLSRLASELELVPELDMVYAHVQEFVSPEFGGHVGAGTRMPFYNIPGKLPTHMLIRREAFLRVGEFTTERTISESIEWHARALHCGLRHTMVPETLWQRRLHDGNHSRKIDYSAELPRMLKRALDRRRAG